MTLPRRIARIFRRPPDFYVGGKEHPYLQRWHVIPRNPIFNIYLHKFLRDDDDRALHDHPWVSMSIVLKGRFIEHLPSWRMRYRRAGQIIFRRAVHTHRIELFGAPGLRLPAWTLFITGPRIREWGFHCPQGWRPHYEFTDPADGGQIGKGCD